MKYYDNPCVNPLDLKQSLYQKLDLYKSLVIANMGETKEDGKLTLFYNASQYGKNSFNN